MASKITKAQQMSFDEIDFYLNAFIIFTIGTAPDIRLPVLGKKTTTAG